MTNNKPIAKFEAGQISAALWAFQAQTNGQTVTMLKASVERRYKDRDGQWQSSTNFTRNEIPLAIWCLQRAFNEIIARQQQDGAKAEIERAITEQQVM